jgi:DNA end-binding protein Ku
MSYFFLTESPMATSSRRVLWKGAITFGLVHIPIALHSATSEQGLDFDWLDKRSMDPVGYKRVNKRTGEEIKSENIVKGIEYEDGQYVVLTPEEISAAYPKTTQTIEIEAFVDANSIPYVYLERPYYISPINRGAKVYALLREILRKTNKVGIAKVVIQTKQHLAMLAPSGPALVLDLLRWGDEIRTWEELNLPPEGVKAAGISDKELSMAEQLVADMTDAWNPGAFTDSFKEQILKLVEEKVQAGETEAVSQPEKEAVAQDTGAQIYDLTEMLRRSLNPGGAVASGDKPVAKKTAPKVASDPADSPVAERRKTPNKAPLKAPPRAPRKAAPAPQTSSRSPAPAQSRAAATSSRKSTTTTSKTSTPRKKAA